MKLDAPSDIGLAREAFTRVFRACDPFGAPFQPSVERRMLLYPVDYTLAPAELAAVCSAAAAIGEHEAFISLTEDCDADTFDVRDHWKESLDAAFYRTLGARGFFPLMESALYSVKGTWGILFSHEQHAVAGGSASWVDNLSAEFAHAETGIQRFLETWKDNRQRLRSNPSWMVNLLRHLYGLEGADQLLLKACWWPEHQ